MPATIKLTRKIVQTACTASLAVVFFALFMPSSAETQTRVCLRLERQLASLSNSRTARNPARVLKFNAAIKRQKNQIRQAKRKISRGRCSTGIFGAASRRGPSCRSLKRSLKDMQSNLAKLRAQRNKYSGRKGSTSRERRRIKRAIAANRCNKPRPTVTANRSGVVIERNGGRRSIVDQIYGRDPNDRDRRRASEFYPDDTPYSGSRFPRSGSYRTMCVRTCDGYYFPVNYSTRAQGFDRDIQACTAKCPGVQTELYYYSANQQPEDMVSAITGEPYKSLPTAFNYRTAITPGCGCKSVQAGYRPIAGDGLGGDGFIEEKTPFITTPTFRSDPGEDPETLENARGSFVPRQLKAINKPLASSKKRKVRVVGEAFFPTQ